MGPLVAEVALPSIPVEISPTLMHENVLCDLAVLEDKVNMLKAAFSYIYTLHLTEIRHISAYI